MPLNRLATRLRDFDYCTHGAYFVTICTHQRRCVLSSVIDGELILTEIGRMIEAAMYDIAARFQGVHLDAQIVMPDHVHMILILENLHDTRPFSGEDTSDCSKTASLIQIVRAIKSITGILANRSLGNVGVPFWQRSFHDRVIRNEIELESIRRYIYMNPERWGKEE